MKTITINGKEHRLVAFLDDFGNQTFDHLQASSVLIQRFEERKPQGAKQNYRVVRLAKGSVRKGSHDA